MCKGYVMLNVQKMKKTIRELYCTCTSTLYCRLFREANIYSTSAVYLSRAVYLSVCLHACLSVCLSIYCFIDVQSKFHIECTYSKSNKPKQLLQPITKDADHTVNQSKLEVITCTIHVADTKHEKMSVSESQLILLLLLIG